MAYMDPDRQRYAARVAVSVAHKFGRLDDRDEYIAAAWLAVLEEEARDPEGVAAMPFALFGRMVAMRLTDWYRRENGRHHPKPHVGALSIDAPRRTTTGHEVIGFDRPDPTVDVEAEAIGNEDRLTLAELIDVLANAVPPEEQARVEDVCRWLAEGRTLAWIGAQLNVTESRACQIVADLRDRALTHPYVAGVVAGVLTAA